MTSKPPLGAAGVHVATPLGVLALYARDGAVCHAWFVDEGEPPPPPPQAAADAQACASVAAWYAAYFAGERVDGDRMAVALGGSALQRQVWAAVQTVPYGTTTNYGALTASLGLSALHIRAVAGAVARNPIAIAVPCHRVIGRDGSLTGFAGGLARKRALLALERGGALPALGQLAVPLGGLP